MDPGQVHGAWLLFAVLAGSHLGHQNKPQQKIKRKMVPALSGHRLSATHNNQQGVGGRGRRDV
jgi:hypothetical protein